MASPERCGRHRRRELGIYDDRFLPGLSQLTAAIHAQGAKASIQLGHAGGHTRADVCGEEPIAPSAIPHVVQEVTTETIVPLAMTRERIEETTAAFVRAAERARAAGFDCVEIHAAHGYLISQFHTPFENRRNDEYGGSLENRARFGLDLTRRVKKAVPDLGVIYRVTVDDFFPEGLQLDDGLQIAEWAAGVGADAIHVAAGHYRSVPEAPGMIPPMARPDAAFLPYARALKPRIGVPVIAVGRLGDPMAAQEAVAQGACDFVALGRPLLADADWARKVKAGEPVRRCIACNTCITGMRTGGPLYCLVNARTGREREFADAKGPQGKRIAVIGAGPAGLTYASLVGGQNDVVRVRARDASRRRLAPGRAGTALSGGRGGERVARSLYRGAGRSLLCVSACASNTASTSPGIPSGSMGSITWWWRPERAIAPASAGSRRHCSRPARRAGRSSSTCSSVRACATFSTIARDMPRARPLLRS